MGSRWFMKGLVFLFLAIIPIVGFWVGNKMARNNNTRAAMDRKDRLELSRLRRLERLITTTAAEHSALGEPGAVIILDQINQSHEGATYD